MVSSWVILPILLLCAVSQTKTFPSEHPTEAPNLSAKNASGHEVHNVGSGSGPNAKNASGQAVHSAGHTQNATTGLTHTEQNRTTGHSNQRGKPQFRRYYDLMNGTPVISKRHNDQWVRLHPAVKEGEQHESNITRFIRFDNGSRIARRSMYDYSYDGVSWFRLSRIRVPIGQTQNGTIFKYRYGPKRWVDPFFRNRYVFNSTNMTFEDMGPSGQTAHSAGNPQNTYRNYRFYPNNLEHSYGRLNYRRRSYRYGMPFDPRTRRYYYGDRDRYYRYPTYRYDYPRRNNYYYDPYRNTYTYNDPRFAQNNPQYYYSDGRWAQPHQQRDAGEYYDRRYATQQPYDARRQTYDDRRYGYDNTYNDGRYGSYGTHNTYDRKRYDGTYDDGRYASPYGSNDGYNNYGRRYPNDGTHDDGRYRNDGTHDDRRYRS